MDKADKRALEKYPKRKDGRTRNYACSEDDVRRLYAQGYRKAEKDLALTWEDMVLLRTLFDATDANQAMGALTVQPMTREYYEYLLREFNETREKK